LTDIYWYEEHENIGRDPQIIQRIL